MDIIQKATTEKSSWFNLKPILNHQKCFLNIPNYVTCTGSTINISSWYYAYMCIARYNTGKKVRLDDINIFCAEEKLEYVGINYYANKLE